MMTVIWNSTGISSRFIGELQEYCKSKSQIEKVVLFGSRARGDFKKTSDIDLAFFTNELTHSEQNLIENDIHQMSTPLKIDIVFFNRLTKNKLISNILNDGVIIYEQGATL